MTREKNKNSYFILSLDGGGIRGVFTARILERLHSERPGFLNQCDLVAGTSTGSIIAMGLSLGKTPRQLVDFYRDKSNAVFKDSLYDDIRDLGRLQGAEYSLKGLKKELKKEFGTSKLGDIAKNILIPTFDLDNQAAAPAGRTWKPKFFHNFQENKPDAEELAVDVVLRSCAAPVYFPSYQGFIDGGVVANNPAMAAIAQVLKSKQAELDEICVLSLGTGMNPEYIKGDRLDWGLAQWAPILIRLMSGAAMGVVDYQCRQLLGSRYQRLSTIYEKPVKIDSLDDIDRMIAIADGIDIEPVIEWIEQRS